MKINEKKKRVKKSNKKVWKKEKVCTFAHPKTEIRRESERGGKERVH